MNHTAAHDVASVRDRALGGILEASQEVSRVDQRLRRAVREKPVATALLALGAGFVLGRFVARL